MFLRKVIKKVIHRVKTITNHPLTRDRKLWAVRRYLFFHLHQMLIRRPLVYTFIDHVKFWAEKGMAGIVGNIYTGLYEFEEMVFLLHFLRKEDTFLDVGANVGAFSLLASGKCEACTIAVEPVPSTYKQLISNVVLNNLENQITCLQLGLADKAGVLDFSQDKGTMNRVMQGNKDGIKVSVKTIDSLFKDKVPSLIKIDVEGFEYLVLKGAEKILSESTCQAIIIEINGSGAKYGFLDEDIHDLLTIKGFKPVNYDPFTREIQLMDSFNKRKFNTIYIKDDVATTLRLRSAKQVKVFEKKI